MAHVSMAEISSDPQGSRSLGRIETGLQVEVHTVQDMSFEQTIESCELGRVDAAPAQGDLR